MTDSEQTIHSWSRSSWNDPIERCYRTKAHATPRNGVCDMGVQRFHQPEYCLTLAQCLKSAFHLLHLRDCLRAFGRDVSPAIRLIHLTNLLMLSANRWAPNSKLTLAEKEAKAGKAYTELEHAYNDLPSFMRLTSSPRVIRTAHHYSFQLVTSLFSSLLTRRPLASIR